MSTKLDTTSVCVSVGMAKSGGRFLQRKLLWRFYVGGLALLTLVSINFFIPGSSIKCVQCNTSKMASCAEEPPPARACEKDMKFCLTTKELLNNGTILSVSRECSASNLGSSCTEITPTDLGGTNKCHWTCDSDGCNGAMVVRMPIANLVFISAIGTIIWNCNA